MKSVKNYISKQKKITKRLLYIQFILVIFFVIALPTYIGISFSSPTNIKIPVKEPINNTISVNNKIDYLILNNSEFIYDMNNIYKSITIEEFLVNDKMDEFSNKIIELIYLKYPNFIANIFINDTVTKKYTFYNEKLVIEFNNHGYENYIIDNKLNIYYKEIDDYINLKISITNDYINENGFNINENKKLVALTYDDGPHKIHTDTILDHLNNNKAHATFFTLGLSIKANPEQLKRIYETGNEIGIHGYSHTNFTRMSLDEVQKEIDDVNNLLLNITGDTAKYIRPPYGSINSSIENNINYTFIKWSVDPFDWKNKELDVIVNEIINNVEAGDIILMHDIFESSAVATEKILQELYLRGFQVVDVSTLAEHYNIELQINEVYRNFN